MAFWGRRMAQHLAAPKPRAYRRRPRAAVTDLHSFEAFLHAQRKRIARSLTGAEARIAKARAESNALTGTSEDFVFTRRGTSFGGAPSDREA